MSDMNLLTQMRLLIIEDDDFQRDELSQYLRRRVKKIYQAKNGEEGYQKYVELKPDMIITDLRMPKMDGLALLNKIRTNDRITPVIITSAMNDKETILKSLDFGITNYLVKPVNVNELQQVLMHAAKLLLDIKGDEYVQQVENQKLNELKNQITKFIKQETGKGPGDVRIKMMNQQCQIKLIAVLTPYEQSFIENDKNINLCNHNRNVFMLDRQDILNDLLFNHLSISYMLTDVRTDAKQGECLLTFTL